MAVVDVDHQETWPPHIMASVEKWAEQCRGTTAHTADLEIPIEAEQEFRQMFAGRGLRTYHATRLLPHERELIANGGLRTLSKALVEERIQRAVAETAITADEGALLRANNVFAMGHSENRRDQVCLMLSDFILRSDRRALGDLLTLWGGEAMFKESMRVRPLLATLGVPTLVTAAIDVSNLRQRHSFFPSLHRCFVGAYLNLQGSSADIFYSAPIPAGAIERVAQPGEPWYDQFVGLPRR